MQTETDKLIQLRLTIERLSRERSEVNEQLTKDMVELQEVERLLATAENQERAIALAISEKERSVGEYEKMIKESETAYQEMFDSAEDILRVLEAESRQIQSRNSRIVS